MKRLLFLSILFSLICFSSMAIAQQLQVVTLDEDNVLFASPSTVVLNAGDTLQFKAINGHFAIYIEDAALYFDYDEADINIQVNSAKNPLSDKYVSRSDNEIIEITYSIYCISCNNWPEAPPRIIISSQD